MRAGDFARARDEGLRDLIGELGEALLDRGRFVAQLPGGAFDLGRKHVGGGEAFLFDRIGNALEASNHHFLEAGDAGVEPLRHL